MANDSENAAVKRGPWWKSIGPALITACVVFGPGSLLISSKVGANFGYEFVWLLLLTGLLMGTYLTMGARIGVCGGATPCTLVSQRLGRPAAFVIGLTLCLICATFQFSNNLAVALAAGAFFPKVAVPWIVVGFNLAVIFFLFTARQIYKVLERVMKVMVGVILACFVFDLIAAKPDVVEVFSGFVPQIPEKFKSELLDTAITNPVFLIAGLLGTTFSVAGAFFQGNLVRERNWTVKDYEGSLGDAVAGVCVLTGVSMIIMITAGTVIFGKPADNIGELALSLKPLLGPTAYWVFCIGLVAVAMNPFLINAVIGGTILADGVGAPARMSDRWPRVLTVIVMAVGMVVALLALTTGVKTINLIVFGQSLTVLGNPLMAIAMLWLANRKDVMGDRRNGLIANFLGGVGLLVVVSLAVCVIWKIVLTLS
jgi:Mn2+/Fe2+ NRAMP family transporter